MVDPVTSSEKVYWQRLWSVMKVVPLAVATLAFPSCDSSKSADSAPAVKGDVYADRRRLMVETQIAGRGIRDTAVLEAVNSVPRHLFVPKHLLAESYEDGPLPIGHGQTISQPYIVAFMTEALKLKPTDRVLEVGTGCGYQAAVLARLVKEVFSIEIVEPLADEAKKRLAGLGYDNVKVKAGDGYTGWPEEAPFDAIILTAAPRSVPQPLIEQLKPGGRLIAPVGSQWQSLVMIRSTDSGITRESLLPVRFVPMTGKAAGR